MSNELAFSPRTCMIQGEGLGLGAGAGGFSIFDFGFWIEASAFFEVLGTEYWVPRTERPGFSYQTEPAEMSSKPSLLKSPMPTPSLRKARSSVVFLKDTLTGLPSAGGFDC